MKKTNNEDYLYLLDKYGFYLSIENICELLKVSRPTVDSMIQRAELPAIKVGKQYRVSCSDFLSWSTNKVKKTQKEILNGLL